MLLSDILSHLLQAEKGNSKMKITKIEVDGFRNIQSSTINFKNVTALLSLNGYGKSNLMDAIAFSLDFIKRRPKSKSSLMSARNCIPKNKVSRNDSFSFSVNFDVMRLDKPYNVEYSFSFLWGIGDENGKINYECLKMRSDEKGQKYKTYIDRYNETSHYTSSETGRCSSVIKIAPYELIINKLIAFDDLFFHDIIVLINELEVDTIRVMDASRKYKPSIIEWKDSDNADFRLDTGIPRILSALQSNYENKYELLVNAFQTLFPNYISIIVQETPIEIEHFTIQMEDTEDNPFKLAKSVFTMSVLDKNLITPIEFKDLSDGAQRVFLMLTYAILADIKGVPLLLIEEPENCVHPKLLQDYISILSQLAGDCKILISSHSPYLIQYLDPNGIYVGIPNSNGWAAFKPLKASKLKALYRDAAEDDESIGTYLFNLLSQSEDGSMLLESYLEG
ncbi:MAG: AAA family ATPase [Oscillospiraceae bacterium]|jgi:AAA15 family ATPase/GTPase|nr:AAA family ATPase [Oscillospiraceae bacterium]